VTEQSIYKSAAGQQAVMALYDSILARWPVPYEALTVPTRYGSTFIVASGDVSAPPLVLLHGMSMNSAMWLHDVAELSREHRVLAVDIIGEPGKSAQNHPDWDGPAYAEWFGDVLDGLGVEEATLLGASLGGWMALRFATHAPQRVRGLVLMAPSGVVAAEIRSLLRLVPLMMMGRWGIERMMRVLSAGRPVHPELVDIMALVAAHVRQSGGSPPPIFTDEELRRLTMPVMSLIGGRETFHDAEKLTARLRALVPDLTATIVPEAGHIYREWPALVLPFLASLRADGDSAQ
jgi:pimeloyl-ACP methyl ester carboxylesterase